MTNDNLKKVHELIQNRPWHSDILKKIEKLIESEPDISVKRMMGMSMSAVMLELDEQDINKSK